MSGEDEYSIMYIPARDLYKFTDGGYLCDLTTFPDIKLDKPWWSKSYNDSCTINGQLYAAVGASQLMYIDSLWCLFLNESMMADLGLDTPYDLVRTGKWTIDRLDEYMNAGAQLNGGPSRLTGTRTESRSMGFRAARETSSSPDAVSSSSERRAASSTSTSATRVSTKSRTNSRRC